jgi:hypothetical protein
MVLLLLLSDRLGWLGDGVMEDAVGLDIEIRKRLLMKVEASE